jgi:hypothetical protein
MENDEKRLNWLDEFEELAEDILSQQDNSGCDQIHPLVSDWYNKTMMSEPPDTRPSVMQAMACLTSEILSDMPESLFDVMSEHLDEDEVALWIQEILLIGRAFENSLKKGELDDL